MESRRFMEQLRLLQEIQPQDSTRVQLAVGPADSPQYIYEKGHVLVHENDHAEVVDALSREFGRRADGTERVNSLPPVRDGYAVRPIKVGDGYDGGDIEDPDVDRALRCVREMNVRAKRELLSRRHLVTITPNACPADEPSPPSAGERINPGKAEGAQIGSPVSVLVVDTGLVVDWELHEWAKNVRTSRLRKTINEWGDILMYAGHGTFITGLIATVASNTMIDVSAGLNNVAAMSEDAFGAHLQAAVAENGWPDIISLSAGTSIGSPSNLHGLHGLGPFMEDLMHYGDRTVLVAAAGNNGVSDRFWPAAYADDPKYGDAVVSVGALRADGNAAACFTGYGPWVKVYAPGERLVGAFTGLGKPREYTYRHSTFDLCQFHLDYYPCTCKVPPHVGQLTEPGHTPTTATFTGFAKWSGTSFAAPLVAALIAQHMTDHPGTSSRDAAKAVLATKEHAHVHGRTVPAVFPPTWESQ